MVVLALPIWFAIQGAITIACIPGWRMTLGNLLIFVVGGIVGFFVPLNLIGWAVAVLGLHIRVSSGSAEFFSYFVLFAGIEIGGIGAVWAKLRIGNR